VTVPASITEPVRRVLGWLLSLRDSEGRIICPVHKIEHTGKNAGVIVMACELAKLADDEDRDELLAVAVQQAKRLVARLEREGESTCFTFRPGRHDPYNCSNNVIDGAACSDALAELVLTFGERLSSAEREAFTHASVLHAQTYLRYCILDKGVPAQRAWAMTGVSSAFRLAGHEVLSLATTEGVGILEGVQHPDGSYPYHPIEWGAGHPGASDVSSFYQSRVTAFLLFSLERLGRNPHDDLFWGPIVRGLDFLQALQGPDGIKCGLLEAKPWYFGAEYEVGSHPFDVYALARGWHHERVTARGVAARRAFDAWVRHLAPNGEPRDHLPGPGRAASYQCPVFWAGHASWLARSMDDLAAISELPGGPPTTGKGLDLRLQHFPDASLTRLEDDAVAAWVRGARPAFNVAHGSPHGAGLIRVWSKSQERDVLARRFAGATREGEWSGKAGTFSFARGWRSGAKEVRFAWWLARNHWRAGQTGAAALVIPRTFERGVLAFGTSRVGSGFERAPRTELLPDGVQLASRLARRDGSSVAGSELVRSFRVDGDGLVVDDRLDATGGVRGVDYALPAAASDVQRDGLRVRYRLS